MCCFPQGAYMFYSSRYKVIFATAPTNDNLSTALCSCHFLGMLFVVKLIQRCSRMVIRYAAQ